MTTIKPRFRLGNQKISAKRIAILKVVEALLGPDNWSVAELAEESGMSKAQLRLWINEMRRMRLIYLSEWKYTILNNPSIPAYHWMPPGEQKSDVKRPPKNTDAERMKHFRYRARQRDKRILAALRGESSETQTGQSERA